MFDPTRGYPTVVPYVRYADPGRALAWLTAVAGAVEGARMTLPDGRLGHAELVLGGSVVAIGLAPGDGAREVPAGRDAVRAMTLVFVDDVDAATRTATELGGTLVDAAVELPWGLRQSIVADPEGHVWELTQHLRDVPFEAWGAEQTGPWPAS